MRSSLGVGREVALAVAPEVADLLPQSLNDMIHQGTGLDIKVRAYTGWVHCLGPWSPQILSPG